MYNATYIANRAGVPPPAYNFPSKRFIFDLSKSCAWFLWVQVNTPWKLASTPSGKQVALAGMAQWIEHQKVAGLIPRRGTCLGCRSGPQLGVCERQQIDVSLSFSLPSLLSKNK